MALAHYCYHKLCVRHCIFMGHPKHWVGRGQCALIQVLGRDRRDRASGLLDKRRAETKQRQGGQLLQLAAVADPLQATDPIKLCSQAHTGGLPYKSTTGPHLWESSCKPGDPNMPVLGEGGRKRRKGYVTIL
jgi:hypothetical protein